MPKKKTQEEFERDLLIKLGADYKALTPYTNAHGKVRLIHYVCGNEFDKNIHDIMTKGSGCPFCNGSRPSKYNEEWVKDNTPKPYVYISGYKAMKEKCLFYCQKCQTEFEQLPSRLINQHIYGCNCCPTKKLTHEEFLSILGEDCLEEYEVLESYVNTDTPIRLRHKECNCVFSITPDHFLRKYRKKYCPICYYRKSHGEIAITTFLTQRGIDYQREFTFPNLPKRRFDFYLPQENIVIEFDGAQHYMAIDFFGGEESFLATQARDQEKNKFCLSNGIKLFRIPYSEIDNVSQILFEILEEKRSTTIERFLIKQVEQRVSQ